MSSRRLLVVVVVVAFALSAASAFAAGLTTTSKTLAAGTTAVARCDTTPVFTYTFVKNAGGQVTSVTVADIDVACAGGALSLVARPAGATGGPITVATCAATCTATVPLSATPLPSQVTSIALVIVGP